MSFLDKIKNFVNVDEDGKKVLSATPSSEIVAPAVKYGVVESPEDTRVISAREGKHEIIVSPEDAMTIAAAEDKPVAALVCKFLCKPAVLTGGRICYRF